MKWLGANPVFPFTVKRMADDDGVYFVGTAKHEPFRLGHTMKVLNLIYEDDLWGHRQSERGAPGWIWNAEWKKGRSYLSA